MARRIVDTIIGKEGRTVRVYRDAECDEFVVRLFENGKVYPPADYFTNDRQDATGTALKMLEPTT
jgi:hypothetical protein